MKTNNRRNNYKTKQVAITQVDVLGCYLQPLLFLRIFNSARAQRSRGRSNSSDWDCFTLFGGGGVFVVLTIMIIISV